MDKMYSLLTVNLIMPFVMVSVGHTFKKHPASDMDSNNGYNTPTSRKTREHWEYAQSIAPDIFISFGKALGLIEILLSVVMYLCLNLCSSMCWRFCRTGIIVFRIL